MRTEHSPAILLIIGLAFMIPGCAATDEGFPADEQASAGSLLLHLAAEGADASRMEWLPVVGRMTDSLRRRHLPINSGDSLLWIDRFDRGDGRLGPAWRTIAPTGDSERAIVTKAVRIDSSTGLEIAAGPGFSGECRLERPLSPDQLHGRDVRFSLTLGCPSQRRLERLQGVRLSIITAEADSEPQELFLPISAALTPGWETLNFWLRFGPNVGPTALRLYLLDENAGIVVGRMDMNARDWLKSTSSAESATTQPTPAPTNLIAGGDFETGRRTFYASILRKWPNGEETTSPLPFDYDGEAVVGERSLRLRIASGTGRLGFGPVDLRSGQSIPADVVSRYVKLYGRTSRSANVTALLRSGGRIMERTTFAFGTDWQVFTAAFRITPGSAADRAALACAELVLDIPTGDSGDPLECWLDGLSLTDGPTESYRQAEPVEVGISGPARLPADLDNVVSENQTTVFLVELSANRFDAPGPPEAAGASAAPAEPPVASSGEPAISGPVGKLALDVLDGWDRPVWTRTTEPVMPASGRYAEKVSLRLPRGYYRLLASLWSAEPGESRLISQDERAVAVISFQDPVPLENRFGLAAAARNISGYTTAFGAGWVRVDLPAQRIEIKPGEWDFAAWRALMESAKRAEVQIVAALTLPAPRQVRRSFMDAFLTSSPLQPSGLVISPPVISTRPVDEYTEQLEWLGQTLAVTGQDTRVVCDVSALHSGPGRSDPVRLPRVNNLVAGYACTEGLLPEQSERLLEQIGLQYKGQSPVWDLGVPVRLGGVSLNRNWTHLAAAGSVSGAPVSRLETPLDPVLSASRMIRSILIRALAGTELVCCDAVLLDPPATLHQSDRDRLHEIDLTPRPAAVAFERMTSLLNDATLVRWIDHPGGCHVLYFEKDDGGAVAALWRTFGLSPSYLSLPGLPSTVPIVDCLGMPESTLADGDLRVTPVNEMIRYVIASPGEMNLLAEALEAARVRGGPPEE